MEIDKVDVIQWGKVRLNPAHKPLSGPLQVRRVSGHFSRPLWIRP